MSADIIQFIRPPRNNEATSDFPTIAFRAPLAPDDLTMDHVDTAPREIAAPEPVGSTSSDT